MRHAIVPPVDDRDEGRSRFFYPGFQAIYGTDWSAKPVVSIDIPEEEFEVLRISDAHTRVYKTVGLYADRILRAHKEDERRVDVWFVVIPEDIYRLCRPNSRVPKADAVAPDVRMTKAKGKELLGNPSLFEADNAAAVAFAYEVDFHNQLKARLLQSQVAVQVVREGTLALTQEELDARRDSRDVRRFRAEIAWNVTNAAYYKAGVRPWKVDDVREGVCYLGLVFKQDDRASDPRTACCAAQMFLDSGDGVVFKGAVGPWYNTKRGDFHLKPEAAADLVGKAVQSYTERMGAPPKELFIHGKTRFLRSEWEGFRSGVPDGTDIVGVRIRSEPRALRLYRHGSRPALRGLAHIHSDNAAHLWTRGFVPRHQTYPGREVPVPLLVEVSRGRADLSVVLRDVLALTKLNYNTTNFADGLPVTLRFADAVGEILTAGPMEATPPLPFRYYI